MNKLLLDYTDSNQIKKFHQVQEYSDPKIVFQKAKKMGYNINVSTRKDKKYMVETPERKMVHFGAMGYEDFSLHQDNKRKKSFQNRNRRWADADPYSASFLSYNLLW
jgi:hypothetical protein